MVEFRRSIAKMRRFDASSYGFARGGDLTLQRYRFGAFLHRRPVPDAETATPLILPTGNGCNLGEHVLHQKSHILNV
ncbi:hypothetical protein SAMN05216330_12129 [Bradyrhizobium sp. Ghvi]|uniref:hypothetical protein n=1 Tax=Bradyrhizobium sp. Ghvi TaxID=1855319 RepID=UPI0008F26E29|nr:hypothetical protein [Bradyrhizobium sp. Ghvi]SFQ25028.1 hypothetical protein SAMN05216330_12129 [Bradyrhizobium sp. Ghvi]